jgi:hypothetical protein
MARQVLSDKTVRKYARHTGLPIERMIARGGSGHWLKFRTADHRHGWVRAGTYDVEWEQEPVVHWTSCAETFPAPPIPVPLAGP